MKNYFLLIFFIVGEFASAQNISTSCFTLGGFYIEDLFTSTPTFDGNLIMAGTTNTWNDGGNDRNLYLVKCEASGNILWTHSQGCSSYDDLFSIIETSDHSFVITGGANDDLLLAKYASDGTHLWTKQVDFFGTETGFDIIETSEGGYLISGEAFEGLGEIYCAVVKLDADGNVIWSKIYLTGDYMVGFSVTEMSGHRYVIIGQADLPFVLCLDNNGNEIWGKESTHGGLWYDVVATTDSCVVLAGYHCYTSCDASLMKVDKNGDTIWSHAYFTPLFDVFYSISSTTDGGFVAAGKASNQIDTTYGYIVKCNSEGDVQWIKAIYDALFVSIHQTTDGGYVACGNLNGDFHFVKLDADGNSCSECGGFSYGVQSSGTSLSDATFTELTQTATVLDTTLSEHTGGTVHIFCNEVGIEETESNNSSLILFPDPADEFITVRQLTGWNSLVELFVLDVTGRKMFNILSNEVTPGANEEFTVNTSSLAPSTYLLVLKNKEKIQTQKFVVQH